MSQQQFIGKSVIIFEYIDAIVNEIDLSQYTDGSDAFFIYISS